MILTAPEIEHFDLVISGFRQNRFERTGVEALWQRLRAESGETRCVQQLQWNEDWKAIARWVKRVSGPKPRICVYSYSWGVGWGTTQLAKQLGKLGLEVAHVVSADGVYRSRILPAWLPANVVSMLSWPKITMPANVRRVDWSYQDADRPAGHEIVAADPERTVISEGVPRAGGHLAMDEDEWWHRRSLEVAGVQGVAHV